MPELMKSHVTMAEIRDNPVYSFSIADLQLSDWLTKACGAIGNYFVAEVMQKSHVDILKLLSVKRAHVDGLVEALADAGIGLNTAITDAPSNDRLLLELKKLRDAREKNLTELEQCSAPERYKTDELWFAASRELLLPELSKYMEPTDRHHIIIAARAKQNPDSHAKIGKTLNLSASRVRVLDRKAVKLLRRMIRARALEPYIS